MSFRMTHESFGPWRDSTVCVSLARGSIIRQEAKLTLEEIFIENRLVFFILIK